MTILLGTVPCIGCKAPVTVVRRPVMIHDTHGTNRYQKQNRSVPSEELREVVPVDPDASRHRCA